VPEIHQHFVVERRADDVWDFFQDIPRVAECMPGVELTEVRGDGSYAGNMKVKLGPIAASFQGDAHIGELDRANKKGTFTAKGVDRQGGNRASADVTYVLAPENGSTKVEVQANLMLQGALAQFGRTGLIQEVSARMTGEFARCLQAKLMSKSSEEAAAVRAPDVKGFTLFFASIWSWLKSKFQRDRGKG